MQLLVGKPLFADVKFFLVYDSVIIFQGSVDNLLH